MKFLVIALSFISFEALAWGPTGHRAVGEVAESLLSADVAAEVYKILDGQSLARVSTWPDEIKSDPANYSHTFSWHYTDWPDEMHDHDEHNSSGSLIKSLREQLIILKSSKHDANQKKNALKFLTHLVGDLHMPLHVGNGKDIGGNSCKVIFMGKTTNLHALWDEGMIEFSKLSFSELALFASQGRNVTEYQQGDILDWALESKNIRPTIYPNSSQDYCRKDISVTTENMPVLSFEYSYKFMPIVEKRIFQAGVRLAFLLNQTL